MTHLAFGKVAFFIFFTAIFLILLFWSNHGGLRGTSSNFDSMRSEPNAKVLNLDVSPHLYTGVQAARQDRREWSRNLFVKLEDAYDEYHKESKDSRVSDPVIPYGPKRYDLIGPVGPKCRYPETYGTKDEEKRACGLKRGSLESECTVLSIGSNNVWDFEESVFNTTGCVVHTFDCTVAPTVQPPSYIRSRVNLHRVCIGDKDYITSDSKRFLSWKSLLQLVNLSKAPTFLKMDIEGFEYKVLEQIVYTGIHLPLQVAVELHYNTYAATGLSWANRYKSPGEIAVFIDHLYRFGDYYVADRHDNPFCAHCTELLLVRL
jgi:hypothetical protein